MIRTDRSSAALVTLILSLTPLSLFSNAFAAEPVSGDDWATIAGSKISEKYSIVKGDTLWGISQRLFGDPKYWPKIWEMNNSTIPDPHWIRPGNTIVFQPGTGSSLPEVAIQNPDGTITPAPPSKSSGEPPLPRSPRKPALSEEWKLLPHQEWEGEPLSMPVGVDAQGFDESAKIKTNFNTGFDLDAVSTTEEIDFLGQITSSRSEGTYLTIGDILYIKPEGDGALQIGETYAITEKPQKLKSSGRKGYSYLVKARVKITSVKDSLFIGTLLSNNFLINRGNYLMKLPPRAQTPEPVAGPSPIPGTILLNKSFSSYLSAQHKLVIIDRGTSDGLAPGMVFRAYQLKDPVTDKKISQSNSLIDADIMVIQLSEKFSTGLVLKSLSPIADGSSVVLLTDVGQMGKHRTMEKGVLEAPVPEKPKSEDELEKLDKSNPEGLGAEEKKELKQLENYKGQPSPLPSASPSPAPELPPNPETSPAPLPTPTPTASVFPSAEPTPTPTATASPEPTPTSTPATEPTTAPNDAAPPAAPPADLPPPPSAPAAPDQLPPEPEVEIPPA